MKEILVDVMTYLEHIKYFFLAVIFSVVNILVRPPKHKAILYVVEFVLSVTVASLVGIVSHGFGLGESLTFLLVACSALIARDMLSLVISAGDFISDNKETLFKILLNKWLKK